MTGEEVIQAVHHDLGRPTDVDPFGVGGALDTGSDGYSYYMGLLNRAVAAVVSWKDEVTGRQFRWKDAFKTKYATNEVVTGTLVAAGTTTSFTTAVLGVPQYYRGWTVRINNEVRTCVDYSATGVVTLHAALTSAPAAADTYELLSNYIEPFDEGIVVDVLKVYSMSNETDLEPGSRGDLFQTTRNTIGQPTEWYRGGGRINFNYSPEVSEWWMVEVYALPDTITSALGELPLPPQMHNGVVLWMTMKGFARMQEMNAKYSTMNEFVKFMRTTKTEEDVSGELDNGLKAIVEVT